MINTLKKRWYLFVLAVIVGGFIFYSRSVSTSAEANLQSYPVKRENVKEVLSLSGQVDAEEKVTLKFQTSGRMTWVGVKEGDTVKKYQTIAALDQRDLSNRLTKYLNTYAITRNTFEETKNDNWNKKYDLSDSIRKEAERVLENNQYSLQNAVLDVEYQSLSLEYANLWTPIDGVITKITSPFAGVNITPAGAEFEVVNPESLYFSISAEQSDVVKMKNGMQGEILFDAFPDKSYKGTVYFIAFSPRQGETGTVYEVRLKLDESAKELPLKLSMTGDIDFLFKEEKNAISIPSSYLKNDNKGDYVYVEKTKKEKRYVEVSEELDGKYIIKSGLTEGDVIYD